MKTLFSIWLCRDGVSSTKSKYKKSSAAANENAVFNLAMPGRSIFDEVKVRKSSKAAYETTASNLAVPERSIFDEVKVRKVEQAANENAVFNLAVPGRGIFDKIQDHKIMKRQTRRQTTQRQNLQPGLYKALNSNQKTLTYKDIRRKSRKTDLFDSVSTREEQSGWNKKSQNRTCGK